MGKALWFIAGARNLTLCWDWVNRVDFVDKLIVKYHMHHVAHKIAMEYFFEHDYDYFIISSDDVLGTPDNVRMILRDEEEHKFPIIGGWCNVKLDKSWAALSKKVHDGIRRKWTSYAAYHFMDIKDVILAKYGYPFFKVWFHGLPLTLIRRETLKRVPFRPFIKVKDKFCTTREAKQQGRGVMFDLQFAIDCWKNKIPVRIDARVFLLHFGMTTRYLRVGQQKPTVKFIPATKEWKP